MSGMKVAKALNVELNPGLDIQSVHQLKKKKNPKAKPWPVIVHFTSYRKGMEFEYKKIKIKTSPQLQCCLSFRKFGFLASKTVKTYEID